MRALAAGARLLPTHHLTIRVPWHDSGWRGTLCTAPLNNTSCLVLKQVSRHRDDQKECSWAGQRFDEMEPEDLPPCLNERVSFMAPFSLTRTVIHPYAEIFPKTHGHFAPTPFVMPPYSAACVPFRWMLRESVEGNAKTGTRGLAEQLQLGYLPDREPDIQDRSGRDIETNWVQELENQLALLDTFFGAIRPQESLCFFYAKKTPLSEKSPRVIIGVGRVLWIGKAQEYRYKTGDPPLRSMVWERNIGHSIRPNGTDGFLFPYQEILAIADKEGIDPEEFIAFAPEEYREAYSYVTELLTHDGAVASLLICMATLHRIKEKLPGPWDQALAWLDQQLNRLWQARGAFPGLGAALAAFGYEWGFRHGALLAYEIDSEREKADNDPWEITDAIMADPATMKSPVAQALTPGMRRGWQKLAPERRALLQIISRSALSEEQALRFYDHTTRRTAGIAVTDAELLANPYLLFEMDRRSLNPITFGAVDRGLFPEESIRNRHPLPKPSRLNDPADQRRVRALVVDILEQATLEGHTLLPRSWIIQRARERQLQPPCPLGENVLAATEDFFLPIVSQVTTQEGEPAYQLDRLVQCRKIIRQAILGRKTAKPHTISHDWLSLVNAGLGISLPDDPQEQELEELARQEKAAALEQLCRARICVLIGPAGTGKTTLLRFFCSLPEIAQRGLLLLAPTGKARVRLEELTGQRGKGLTVAQFLYRFQRYSGFTGAYFPNPRAPRCDAYQTVIVDECSMLTEEQLAALLDALTNVERLVLVGDPRQLPPIGAGRPFVDIVRELQPANVETLFPRCGPCYAELKINRRHQGELRPDMLLASFFSGEPGDPGVDIVFDNQPAERHPSLRLVRWDTPEELQEKIIAELINALELSGADDELGFEESIGGKRYGNSSYAFFWHRYGDNPGAAAKAEAWQILSPIRAGQVGVDALNRLIQIRFRPQVRMLAEQGGWDRKIPRPLGPQGLLYGDKVINVINQRRSDVWPRPEGEAYLANGDIGIIVGQYKTKSLKGSPWKVEVEFAGQLGYKFGFHGREFGEEGPNPLELAYSLTVHKAQGSEFSIVFLVLLNPCWLLSRELLYTALTRHRERVVILHQGSLLDYRRFGSEEHSEIARRLTNLFVAPLPYAVMVGQQEQFLEKSLIHRTERGELVRSKSELVIADKLFARGIDYAYEQPLVLPNGKVRYPDFTIVDQARGLTFYWEHLGLLKDPGYYQRWLQKRAEYEKAGIKPYEEGGGPKGILIQTQDKPEGALNAEEIARLIDEVVLGNLN